MKLPVRLVLLLTLLLSSCAAPVARAQQPAVSSTPVPQATATQTAIARLASPTAQPLPTRVTRAEPRVTPSVTATGAAAATPAPTFLDQYLPRRVKVAETTHFIFYAQDNYMPVDQAWWTQEAESLYRYVSQRVQAEAKTKIVVAFLPPEKRACPVRGLAAQDNPPTILLYADSTATRTYLQAVLAHELGHAIPAQGFAKGLPDNIALTEGLATWAAGKYWAAWKNVPGLDDLIRQYIQNGQYEPIHENTDLHGVYPWQSFEGSSQDCLARRDRVYSEWADFIGYLVNQYGWDKALRLFHSPPPQTKDGQTIEFPPDYEGIYGKSLNQLEWEWLRNLQAEPPVLARR